MIAVIGSTGFVGRAIVRQADDPLRILAVSRGTQVYLRPGTLFAKADLFDRDSLEAACRGASTVIHCASYVGSDLERNELVNEMGTRNVVKAATKCGVRQFLYVSTSGVYGSHRFSGADEQTMADPSSATSHTRYSAEKLVLGAGGVVVRPHLLYGDQDRWVLPMMLRTVETVGGFLAGGNALISTMNVSRFARQVLAIVDAWPSLDRRILHPNAGAPVTIRDFVETCASQLGITLPLADVPSDQELLSSAKLSPHQAKMLLEDNWFSSTVQLPGHLVGEPSTAELSNQDIAWYRQALSISPEIR